MPKAVISIDCINSGVVEALRTYSRYLAGAIDWGWGPSAATYIFEEIGIDQFPQIPLTQEQYEALARIAKVNDGSSTGTNRQLSKLVKAIGVVNDWLQNSCNTTLDETLTGKPPTVNSLDEIVTAYQAKFDSATRALEPVPPVYSPPPSAYWDPVYSGPPSTLAQPEYSPPPSVLREIPPELAAQPPTEADLVKLTGEAFVDV